MEIIMMEDKPLSEKVKDTFEHIKELERDDLSRWVLTKDIKATLKAFKDDILEGRYNCQHCGEGLDEITLNYLIKKHFGSLPDE